MATTVTSIAFVGNTNNILLTGLQDATDGAYLNGALVTVTIIDVKKHPVSGATFPLAMNYVTGSNGNYLATLVHELALLPNQHYKAIIDADGNISGSDRWGHWEFPFTAQVRTG